MPEPKTATVSIVVQIPEDLHDELQGWLELNTGWDPSRTATGAISLFLLQRNAPTNRAVSRHYLNTLFPGEAA